MTNRIIITKLIALFKRVLIFIPHPGADHHCPGCKIEKDFQDVLDKWALKNKGNNG